MTGKELEKKIKDGLPAGLYLLTGKEEYLKRYYLKQIRASVCEDESLDAFNRSVFEGESVDFAALREAVEAPAMMADKKLIEWHLADFSSPKAAVLDEMKALGEAARESGDAVVVFYFSPDAFDCGTLPRRPSSLYTALAPVSEIVDFPPSDEGALLRWIAAHFSKAGIKTEDGVAQELLLISGTAMDALAGEIDKLVYYAKATGSGTVSLQDVKESASRGGESDTFALSNALLDGNADGAAAALAEMERRKVDSVIAFASISRVYADLLAVSLFTAEGRSPDDIAAAMKMHKYKVTLYQKAARRHTPASLSAALSLCREAETTAKTAYGQESYVALGHLLARLLGK